MGTMVYRYGLLAPVDHDKEVREQIWRAHRYGNVLVEIERARRATVRLAYGPLATLEHAAKEAGTVVRDAREAIKRARAEHRARVETDAMKLALSSAREAEREAKRALFEARRQLRESGAVDATLADIEARAGELRRGARALSGVHWGTYSLIEAAHDASRKMPLYDGVEPNDPRFARWEHEGQVGIQVHQKGSTGTGMVAEELHAGIGGEWLRVERVHDTRQGRRAGTRARLTMRIGTSDVDGTPIVAAWPMVMHRAVPPGAIVRRATVSLRRRGPREEWSVELTIQVPSTIAPEERQGHVAINVGWRSMGDTIRVASWVGSDGQKGELHLSKRTIEGLRKPEGLRSTRDKNFNDARNALLLALAGLNVPEWYTLRAKALSQWRSPQRLAALATEWKTKRFAGDESAHLALETWRYHDHHLWAWEASQSVGSHRHRREVYRVFGSQLAKRYRTLVLADFDKRVVAIRPAVGDANDKTQNETARSNRQLASTSELEREAANAFTSRGGTAEYLSAVDITHTCADCGALSTFDAAERIHAACSSCGVVFDQDENAARVLCERWRDGEKVGVARVAEPQEKVGSKWQRAKARKEERQAARKAVASAAE